jgi:hypothetical protein
MHFTSELAPERGHRFGGAPQTDPVDIDAAARQSREVPVIPAVTEPMADFRERKQMAEQPTDKISGPGPLFHCLWIMARL